MNVNIENLEKRKKIVVICLSGALIFITLIAGLFIIKKNNKKDSFESNDIGEVVDENNDNDDENDNKNDEVIVNESNYFFNKRSGQITENILLFLVTGIIFFFWENDKLYGLKNPLIKMNNGKKNCLRWSICGMGEKKRIGIIEKLNWFGLGTFVSLIVITLLVELILHFLIGSISHLFSKDKNKRYFHTLKMSWKKRKQLFSSFSKVKTFFIVLSYLLCGFVIAIVARSVFKRIDPCCGNPIIEKHGLNYFLCFCEDEIKKKDEIIGAEEPSIFEKPQGKNYNAETGRFSGEHIEAFSQRGGRGGRGGCGKRGRGGVCGRGQRERNNRFQSDDAHGYKRNRSEDKYKNYKESGTQTEEG